jgi:spore protease
MYLNTRTDLAFEADELWRRSAGESAELPGVKSANETISGCGVTSVEILDQQGASALCKPVGKYYTLELDRVLHREDSAFEDAVSALAQLLRRLNMPPEGDIVCACLGNPNITPDSVGPFAAENLIVTRHLKRSMPQDFAAFRSVSVVRPGVLGTSGIESAEYVRAFCGQVSPSFVIVVDALASADLSRLGRTLQITDAGIAPGSGVGNDRAALNAAYLGVPVAAVGVPTVVDAGAFSQDELAKGMFVTPRSIDDLVRRAGKLIGYGIDLALHSGLTCADVDMLIE